MDGKNEESDKKPDNINKDKDNIKPKHEGEFTQVKPDTKSNPLRLSKEQMGRFSW